MLVLVGRNLAETMPPAARHLDRLRERGGTRRRRRPAPHRRPPTAPTSDLQPVPGTDLALALGAAAPLVAEGRVDEEYVAARTTGFDGRPPLGRAVVAGAGRAAHRRRRRPSCATLAACSPARRTRVIVLTARGAEQHAQGTDTVLGLDQPGARPRPARHAARRLRLPHRPGQRPGRPRARPEGRPAARLPQDRRPGGPGPRRRRLGRRPGRPAGPGRSAYELLDALGTATAPRAARATAPTSSSPRPTPATSQSGSRRSTCSWSPTSCCRRPPRSPTSCCRSPSGRRRPAP